MVLMFPPLNLKIIYSGNEIDGKSTPIGSTISTSSNKLMKTLPNLVPSLFSASLDDVYFRRLLSEFENRYKTNRKIQDDLSLLLIVGPTYLETSYSTLQLNRATKMDFQIAFQKYVLEPICSIFKILFNLEIITLGRGPIQIQRKIRKKLITLQVIPDLSIRNGIQSIIPVEVKKFNISPLMDELFDMAGIIVNRDLKRVKNNNSKKQSESNMIFQQLLGSMFAGYCYKGILTDFITTLLIRLDLEKINNIKNEFADPRSILMTYKVIDFQSSELALRNTVLAFIYEEIWDSEKELKKKQQIMRNFYKKNSRSETDLC
ncbi:uncharacterized protein ASCRUDRAFT_69775 [Ascoidea rubescens DSM 1968]|uniref:Uncharacterized protein n=1 Tax=Ascoidea rubescens DSM 1968 TaxID=1344418 RepID=A0A1D2VKM1_9ASCO|nr:hypothetical protein ASCRUDRAFT_69775 [Ascoidea rubescens DSM 1968]ODV62087.1 hypothetical protein ASCRUDRAFT_69775 [Ascoidea rubescens DSM 1968]